MCRQKMASRKVHHYLPFVDCSPQLGSDGGTPIHIKTFSASFFFSLFETGEGKKSFLEINIYC